MRKGLIPAEAEGDIIVLRHALPDRVIAPAPDGQRVDGPGRGEIAVRGQGGRGRARRGARRARLTAAAAQEFIGGSGQPISERDTAGRFMRAECAEGIFVVDHHSVGRGACLFGRRAALGRGIQHRHGMAFPKIHRKERRGKGGFPHREPLGGIVQWPARRGRAVKSGIGVELAGNHERDVRPVHIRCRGEHHRRGEASRCAARHLHMPVNPEYRAFQAPAIFHVEADASAKGDVRLGSDNPVRYLDRVIPRGQITHIVF